MEKEASAAKTETPAAATAATAAADEDDWESALGASPEAKKADEEDWEAAAENLGGDSETAKQNGGGSEAAAVTISRAEEKRRKQAAKEEEAERRKKEQLASQVDHDLRSPICCVLGHVDSGKTKLLDAIRQSNVQAGEAGGITQQIGATFFPLANIKEKIKKVESVRVFFFLDFFCANYFFQRLKKQLNFRVPGLLIMDTPGHESFTNLRSRGSSLCDIAILVVDMHSGLQKQTIESIELLRKRHTPFVVALNKIDRLYGWKTFKDNAFQDSLAKQDVSVKREFDDRVKHVVTQFAEISLNAALYYKNTDFRKTLSLIPTSAFTGEGIPDLLVLLIQLSQKMMPERLLKLSTLQCTVLEVKKLHGRGTTLDVILANGELNKGDKIIVCGMNGEPIMTHIRVSFELIF